MGNLAWDHSLETGDSAVDAEHRKIFFLIGELQNAEANAHSREFVDAAIEDITDYAHEHFAHEESLMQRSGYPDYEHHARLHRGFAEEAERLAFELQAGAVISEAGLAVFMSRWLSEHIDAEDRRLVEFIRARTAEEPT